jgi:hypothetical protein
MSGSFDRRPHSRPAAADNQNIRLLKSDFPHDNFFYPV